MKYVKVSFCQKALISLSYRQTDEHFLILKLKIWILVIFKATLDFQMWPSCPYKSLSFRTLRYPQILSNFQSPKFKFSVSGKKNVRRFDVMTKTSASSDKNVPLTEASITLFLYKLFLASVNIGYNIGDAWCAHL